MYLTQRPVPAMKRPSSIPPSHRLPIAAGILPPSATKRGSLTDVPSSAMLKFSTRVHSDVPGRTLFSFAIATSALESSLAGSAAAPAQIPSAIFCVFICKPNTVGCNDWLPLLLRI